MHCGAERFQAGHHRCLHDVLLQRPGGCGCTGGKRRQDCRAGRSAEVITGQEEWREDEQQALQGEGREEKEEWKWEVGKFHRCILLKVLSLDNSDHIF